MHGEVDLTFLSRGHSRPHIWQSRLHELLKARYNPAGLDGPHACIRNDLRG